MGKESFKMQDSSKTDFNVKKIKTVKIWHGFRLHSAISLQENYHLLSLIVVSKNIHNYLKKAIKIFSFSSYVSVWGKMFFIYFNQNKSQQREHRVIR